MKYVYVLLFIALILQVTAWAASTGDKNKKTLDKKNNGKGKSAATAGDKKKKGDKKPKSSTKSNKSNKDKKKANGKPKGANNKNKPKKPSASGKKPNNKNKPKAAKSDKKVAAGVSGLKANETVKAYCKRVFGSLKCGTNFRVSPYVGECSDYDTKTVVEMSKKILKSFTDNCKDSIDELKRSEFDDDRAAAALMQKELTASLQKVNADLKSAAKGKSGAKNPKAAGKKNNPKKANGKKPNSKAAGAKKSNTKPGKGNNKSKTSGAKKSNTKPGKGNNKSKAAGAKKSNKNNKKSAKKSDKKPVKKN